MSRSPSLSLLLCAALLGGCAVEVEERVRGCTSTVPCSGERVCLDGLCVNPSQQVGASGPCEAPALLDAPNLIGNGDFDADGLTGWGTVNGTLAKVASTLPGGFAVRVQGLDDQEYALNDSPSWLQDPPAGLRYCWAAFVRAESATSVVELQVKEYSSSGSRLGEAAVTTPLSQTWQRVRVEYVSVGAPGGFLDLHVRVNNPGKAGESFDVDHTRLRIAP